MTVDLVRERLARVRELTAQLNEHSDQANRVVATVETFLSDVCNVGVEGSIVIDRDGGEDGIDWDSSLRYGRYHDGKYRIFIADQDYNDRNPEDGSPSVTWTAWPNCTRDVRLAAYDRLPDLISSLIQNLEARIAKVQASTASIESLLEFAPPSKKGGKR